jgi:hypothetical protein
VRTSSASVLSAYEGVHMYNAVSFLDRAAARRTCTLYGVRKLDFMRKALHFLSGTIQFSSLSLSSKGAYNRRALTVYQSLIKMTLKLSDTIKTIQITH